MTKGTTGCTYTRISSHSHLPLKRAVVDSTYTPPPCDEAVFPATSVDVTFIGDRAYRAPPVPIALLPPKAHRASKTVAADNSVESHITLTAPGARGIGPWIRSHFYLKVSTDEPRLNPILRRMEAVALYGEIIYICYSSFPQATAIDLPPLFAALFWKLALSNRISCRALIDDTDTAPPPPYVACRTRMNRATISTLVTGRHDFSVRSRKPNGDEQS